MKFELNFDVAGRRKFDEEIRSNLTLTSLNFSVCDEDRRALCRLRRFCRDGRSLYVVHILALSRRILGMALISRSRRRSRDFYLLRDFHDEGTLSSLRETVRS